MLRQSIEIYSDRWTFFCIDHSTNASLHCAAVISVCPHTIVGLLLHVTPKSHMIMGKPPHNYIAHINSIQLTRVFLAKVQNLASIGQCC